MFVLMFYKGAKEPDPEELTPNASASNVDGVSRNETVAVTCPAYQVEEYPDGGFCIMPFKSFQLYPPSVEYRVATKHSDSYDSCFITNAAGKTIDRYPRSL